MVDRVALHLGSRDLVDVEICIESHTDKQGSIGKVSYAQCQEVAGDQHHSVKRGHQPREEDSTQLPRSCWDSLKGNRCRRRGEAELVHRSAYLCHRLRHEHTETAAEGREPVSSCSAQLAGDPEWQALTCKPRAVRL